MSKLTHELCVGLVDRGHEVSWLVNENSLDREWIDDRILVSSKRASPLLGLRDARSHLLEFNPDIIHAHDTQGIYLLNSDSKLIMTSHSNWPRSSILDYKSLIFNTLVEIPQDIILRRSDEVVSVSEYSGEMLSKRKIANTTIYNGVSVPSQIARENTGFLTVGSLDSRKFKHLPEIWETIAKKSDAHLDVVGKIASDDIASRLRNLPRVTIHGMVPEVDPYYKRNSVLLFPSRAEACPLTVLEAQANGLSVVCWDICSNGELVCDQSGKIVAPYNISSFSNSAINQYGNPDPNATREWIEDRFSIDRMIEKYETVYESHVE